jgi:hypothetical protein
MRFAHDSVVTRAYASSRSSTNIAAFRSLPQRKEAFLRRLLMLLSNAGSVPHGSCGQAVLAEKASALNTLTSFGALQQRHCVPTGIDEQLRTPLRY